MRIPNLVLAAVAAAVLLGGCGESEDTETAAGCPPKEPASTAYSRQASKQKGGPRDIAITLDSYQGAENVGVLMAEERGYFAEAGIDVVITSPFYLADPLLYVENETVDFAVSHQPEVAEEVEEGAPVIAVGALVARPTAAMIWLKRSKIRDIADLEGKTIAVPGVPFQEDLLRSVLRKVGLKPEDVKVLEAGHELVPTLVSGRADATFGGSWNLEGAELESRGLKPEITPAQNLGVPAYEELVVIARRDRVATEPRLIRDFMSAVTRGNAAAAKDPEGAVELIEKGAETDTRLDRRAIEAQVDATLPLLSRTGQMDPGQASRLVGWMCGQELIEEEPPNSDLLTNAYLPRP
jgi:putative hydroxymethylpyrimidine transport system substrate-binding protein